MSFGEQFLHNPDLFPARRSGETWGDREVVLGLPGGPYRFAGLSAQQEELALQRFADFRLPLSGAAAVETLLFRAAAEDFRTIDTRGWSYGLDLDAGPDAVRVAGMRLLGRLDWRPGLAGALWTSDAGGVEFPGIFENFCRLLVAYRLHEQGGAVLHGAGVVAGDEAMLFFGVSGAGKSTVSRLALERGGRVLSDDLNALVPQEGGAAVLQGLPFTGDLETSGPATRHPLRGLFRLEKDVADRVVPLSRAEAVGSLLACSPFLNADPHRRGALMSTLLDLVSGVPAWALRFSLSGDMWSIVTGNDLDRRAKRSEARR
jgi:hypothetical protein